MGYNNVYSPSGMMPATLGPRKVLKMEVTTGVLSPGPRRYLDNLDQNRTYLSSRSLPLTGIHFPRAPAHHHHCLL
jgi:hypothetical protein